MILKSAESDIYHNYSNITYGYIINFIPIFCIFTENFNKKGLI